MNGNPAFGLGVTQSWFPQEIEEMDIDPLRGNPESEDVVAILRTLHRPAADAFQDVWSGHFDTDRFWR